MWKRFSCVAVVAVAAAALAAPQAVLAGGAHQKPAPSKIVWGE